MSWLVLTLVSAGVLDSGDNPRAGAVKATAARDELARFQGTWQLISAESDGRKTPVERVRQVRVTIQGRTHTVRFGDQVVARNVSFEIDPSKSPREVTDTINDGPEKGKQIRGIYKLEGETLTSCVAPVGKDRPTEFAAKPGSGYTLRVFKRVKPTEREIAIAEELKRFEGTWRVVAMELEGKPFPDSNRNVSRLILEGDQFTSLNGPRTSHGVFVVDPTVTPKTIDVTFTDGPAKGQTHRGIYELERDTYKVSIAFPEKPRPREFTTKPGGGNVVQIHKREPAKR